MGVGSTGCKVYLDSYHARSEKLNFYAAWSQGAITTMNALSAGHHKFDIRHVLSEVADFCEESGESSFSDALIDVVAPIYLNSRR